MPWTSPCGPNLSGQITKTSRWPIGTGAFTDVYQGQWNSVVVAIKIFRGVHTNKEKLEEITRRLIRESSVWYGLDHENVQPYLGYCVCPDVGPSMALIAPFCKSGTVKDVLARNPAADRLSFVKDISCGLKYLHQKGVIHGDLQGNNVLVDDHGTARLADFGRARVIGNQEYSTALFAGSVEYMAPELYPDIPEEEEPEEGEEDETYSPPFSTMSDVFAFGMLAFEVFTDRTPMQRGLKQKPAGRHSGMIINRIRRGERPRRVHDQNRRIGDSMWILMEECWVREPRDRPPAEAIVDRIV